MEPAGWIDDFLGWAWERHHNILSWYIRPLFLLPLAYFAYRRSLLGVALTLVVLVTSMFWFPASARVDPRVEEFLAFEREWLTGGWTAAKVAMTLLVPLAVGMMCLAFWRRSLVWGLVLINAMAVGKVAWGVIDGSGTGWAMIPPALAGLIVCDALVLYAAHRIKAGSSRSDRAETASAGRKGHHA